MRGKGAKGGEERKKGKGKVEKIREGRTGRNKRERREETKVREGGEGNEGWTEEGAVAVETQYERRSPAIQGSKGVRWTATPSLTGTR